MGLLDMVTGGAGGIMSGASDIIGTGGDMIFKGANFIGFDNMVFLGAAGAGYMFGNDGLTYGALGAFAGKLVSQSALGTMIGAGVGFAVSRVLDAGEKTAEIAEDISEETQENSQDIQEIPKADTVQTAGQNSPEKFKSNELVLPGAAESTEDLGLTIT